MWTQTIRFLCTLLCCVPFASAMAHEHAHDHGNTGLEFHTNKGQWPAQVLYRCRTAGGAVFVERSAFTYVLAAGGPEHGVRTEPGQERPYKAHAYRVHFEGGNALAQRGLEPKRHYVNYFLGNDRTKWAGRVPVFRTVELQEVYPGIGLRVDGHDGLKYDWLVSPGADPSAIVMRFEGQDGLRVADGLLYVSTSAGEVIEQRPVAWQERNGVRIPVAIAYRQQGERISYVLPGGHDATLPLVIDPIVNFSTYSGSTADNFGYTATYDSQGHLYGGGSAFGIGYPVTLGALQNTFGGGNVDMGVSKFLPDGTDLVWSTYIGGFANDLPHSMVVNANDELFILGTTGSIDFPVTPGCLDASFSGGTLPPFGGSYGFTFGGGTDIAVVHLSQDATDLVGSTYLGGSGNDGLNQFVPLLRNYGDPFRGEIIVDDQGRPVIATSTVSTDMPVSSDALQATLTGGLDAYICRLDPQLSSLLWGTYYGGSLNDAGFGVQQAPGGDLYITGGSASSNIPLAGTPADGTFGGQVDGFIARFSATDNSLVAATYVGGAGFDQSYFVQLDVQSNAYVVGQTTGPFPISPGVYSNPNSTQFIQKFSPDLGASVWSTLVGSGGNENISPSAFLVSDCGQIYFSGWGGSTNPAGGGLSSSSTTGLPVTADAFDATTDGSDFYLMVLNADAASLAYATFFGGSASEHVDGGTSRFDKNGIVYQAVCAGCGGLSFPTTPGAYSSTNNSFNCNLGVFKIDFQQNVQVNIEVGAVEELVCLNTPIEFEAVGTADTWLWDLGDGSPTTTSASFQHVYTEPGTYQVTLIGTAVGLCVAVDTAIVEVTVVAPAVMTSAFTFEQTGDCDAFQVALDNTSTGSSTFIWQFGDGTQSTGIDPIHNYAAPGNYTITLAVIDPLCLDTVFSSVQIDVSVPGITLELDPVASLCDGETILLNAGAGFDTYQWSTGQTTAAIDVSSAGTYSVEVTDGFCTGNAEVQVTVADAHADFPILELCPGEERTIELPDPVNSVIWSNGVEVPFVTVVGGTLIWFDAVDAAGCPWTDTLQVVLIDRPIGQPIIPNVFSPNGDGYNDTYLVQGVDAEEFELEVYNRWGMKVFASTSVSVGWNGRLDNGSEVVPDGTYYYILTYKDDCARIPLTTETGHITLLR